MTKPPATHIILSLSLSFKPMQEPQTKVVLEKPLQATLSLSCCTPSLWFGLSIFFSPWRCPCEIYPPKLLLPSSHIVFKPTVSPYLNDSTAVPWDEDFFLNHWKRVILLQVFLKVFVIRTRYGWGSLRNRLIQHRKKGRRENEPGWLSNQIFFPSGSIHPPVGGRWTSRSIGYGSHHSFY